MNENPSTDTIHAPVEPIDACEIVAPTSGHRLRLSELAAQLAGTTERKRALRGKVDTMSRARQAAQGDAKAARQQWSAKLRDSDGTLTRDIQKLRASERSALSLAEEYEAMEAEISAELPRLDLELAEAARNCIITQGDVAIEAAGSAYEQLLELVGTGLAVAFNLFSMVERAKKPSHTELDDEMLAGRFFARFEVDAIRRVDGAVVSEEVRKRLALPRMDMSEVDLQLVKSPIRRLKLQKEIDAGCGA